MGYAIMVDGVPQYAPSKYYLPDGRVITNFDQSEVLMLKYGFKKVIDTPPVYDPATQYVVIDSYVENATEIIIGYSVKEISEIDHEPTIEEQVIALKSADSQHELALAELTDMVINIMNPGGGV